MFGQIEINYSTSFNHLLGDGSLLDLLGDGCELGEETIIKFTPDFGENEYAFTLYDGYYSVTGDSPINPSNTRHNRWFVIGEDVKIVLNDYITYTIYNDKKNNVFAGEWKNKKQGSGKVHNVQIITGIPSLTQLTTCIKEYVEGEYNEWQVKGEFEKLSTYQNRVNEKSIKEKINFFQNEAINSFKSVAIYHFENPLRSSSVVLNIYDAENETFLIDFQDFGSILPPCLVYSFGMLRNIFSLKNMQTLTFVF
jgi:hypothetical protein